jgi:RHS repeat-associated protein
LHRGLSEAKSRTALGIAGRLYDTGIGSRCTGKERDAETQLAYFGARYYSNWSGRFLTPDWAAKATAVPYANFGNPQSLNLYTYGENNPTTFGYPDGHCPPCGEAVLAGGDVSVSGAFFSLGSVLLPAGLGGALAIYAINTIASNNNVKANATLEEVHASNQLIQAKAAANADKGSPAPGTQTGKDQPGKDGKGTTLQPGPHAGEGIPARGPQPSFTPGERDAINAQGRDTGCHTCGSTDPGTKSGNFVPDHQPPQAP